MATLYDRILKEKIKIISKSKNKELKMFWVAVYEGTFITSLCGETVEEAIKDFYSHYNSTLVLLVDIRDMALYKGKENDDPDIRGYYNYSYFDDEGKLVFNVDSLTRPISLIQPEKILTAEMHHGWINRDGNFYMCGFEAHLGFSDELFLTKTVDLSENESKYGSKETILENRGWIKVSSKRFRTIYGVKVTGPQLKTLKNLMTIIGDVNYQWCGHYLTINEILLKLEK